MNAQTPKRLGSCLLVAVLATGCSSLRPLRPFSGTPAVPSDPAPAPTAAASPAESIPGGTVVAAGGSGAAQPMNPTVPPMPPPGALATPRPLPPTPTPNGPAPTDPQSPVMLPPAAPQAPGAHPLLHPNANIDPHIRNTPTAAGGRLALAPYEVPTDRVVELTLHLERLLAQNRDLSARIKDLETAAVVREQALEEAKREVDSLTTEAARVRAALDAQITTLQGKVKQLEEEDVVFLRAVIDALSRLFPEKRP